MNQPAKKLNWKNIGLYKIEKVVSFYAYQLKLFNIVKIHFVFYMLVFCFAAFALNALFRQIQDPSLSVKMDNKDKYFVKKVVDIKYNKWKRQYMYLIKWRGYTKPL